jgi:hypothetical protein
MNFKLSILLFFASYFYSLETKDINTVLNYTNNYRNLHQASDVNYSIDMNTSAVMGKLFSIYRYIYQFDWQLWWKYGMLCFNGQNIIFY